MKSISYGFHPTTWARSYQIGNRSALKYLDHGVGIYHTDHLSEGWYLWVPNRSTVTGLILMCSTIVFGISTAHGMRRVLIKTRVFARDVELLVLLIGRWDNLDDSDVQCTTGAGEAGTNQVGGRMAAILGQAVHPYRWACIVGMQGNKKGASLTARCALAECIF